jgi:hypothetical protein
MAIFREPYPADTSDNESARVPAYLTLLPKPAVVHLDRAGRRVVGP